jgi:hypothetical protein
MLQGWRRGTTDRPEPAASAHTPARPSALSPSHGLDPRRRVAPFAVALEAAGHSLRRRADAERVLRCHAKHSAVTHHGGSGCFRCAAGVDFDVVVDPPVVKLGDVERRAVGRRCGGIMCGAGRCPGNQVNFFLQCRGRPHMTLLLMTANSKISVSRRPLRKGWPFLIRLTVMTRGDTPSHESHDRFPLPLTLLPRGEKGVS